MSTECTHLSVASPPPALSLCCSSGLGAAERPEGWAAALGWGQPRALSLGVWSCWEWARSLAGTDACCFSAHGTCVCVVVRGREAQGAKWAPHPAALRCSRGTVDLGGAGVSFRKRPTGSTSSFVWTCSHLGICLAIRGPFCASELLSWPFPWTRGVVV